MLLIGCHFGLNIESFDIVSLFHKLQWNAVYLIKTRRKLVLKQLELMSFRVSLVTLNSFHEFKLDQMHIWNIENMTRGIHFSRNKKELCSIQSTEWYFHLKSIRWISLAMLITPILKSRTISIVWFWSDLNLWLALFSRLIRCYLLVFHRF